MVGRGFSIRESRTLPPVYRLLCPEREGKRGAYPDSTTLTQRWLPSCTPGRNWRDSGRAQRSPLTRREADTPEGCLPEALMGTPVLTAVALSGHLCKLFLDTLEQMSCQLRTHGEWSDCFTGSLGEPTLSCLIFSVRFLLAFLPQLQWEEEAPHTCLIPSRPC